MDIHDTDYAIQPSDYLVSIVEMTDTRTLTLPDATTEVPMGKMYIIKDETGFPNTSNVIIVGYGTPGSRQPIDGLEQGVVINTPKGSYTLVSNGVSWYIV